MHGKKNLANAARYAGFFVPAVSDFAIWAGVVHSIYQGNGDGKKSYLGGVKKFKQVLRKESNHLGNRDEVKRKLMQRLKQIEMIENTALLTSGIAVATVLGYLAKNVISGIPGISHPNESLFKILGGDKMFDGGIKDDVIALLAINIILSVAARAILAHYEKLDDKIAFALAGSAIVLKEAENQGSENVPEQTL